jgi:hypothetical protein
LQFNSLVNRSVEDGPQRETAPDLARLIGEIEGKLLARGFGAKAEAAN